MTREADLQQVREIVTRADVHGDHCDCRRRESGRCRDRREHLIRAFAAALAEREAAARETTGDLRGWLKEIENLSAGYDADGSTGPRRPLSWESVGRMALDYARAALDGCRAP